MKRIEEASAEMQRALELDPLSSFFQCFHGWQLVYSRHYHEAIERLTKVVRAEPNFSSAYLGLWGAFYQKRMFRQALDAARKSNAALDDSDVAQCLASGYKADNYSKAMRGAAAKLTERASGTYVPAIRIARLYAHASEKDRAFEWLEKAFEKREMPLIHLSVAWDWDNVRDDPRFQNLLRQMNLPS